MLKQNGGESNNALATSQTTDTTQNPKDSKSSTKESSESSSDSSDSSSDSDSESSSGSGKEEETMQTRGKALVLKSNEILTPAAPAATAYTFQPAKAKRPPRDRRTERSRDYDEEYDLFSHQHRARWPYLPYIMFRIIML